MAYKKVNFWVVAATILGILLLCCVVYIGVTKYKQSLLNMHESGIEIGYQSAVLKIIRSGQNCQPVNVYAGNYSMDLIDVTCVNGQATATSSS